MSNPKVKVQQVNITEPKKKVKSSKQEALMSKHSDKNKKVKQEIKLSNLIKPR